MQDIKELLLNQYAAFQRARKRRDSKAIPLDPASLDGLIVRRQAGLPPAMAVALTLASPTYLTTLGSKLLPVFARQQLQGYLDTLALFVTVWIEQSTSDEGEEAAPFDLAQLSEFATFPPGMLSASRALLQRRLEWAKKAFSAEDAEYGRELMRKISRRLAAENRDAVYRTGVQIAAQTYLLNIDFLREYPLAG